MPESESYLYKVMSVAGFGCGIRAHASITSPLELSLRPTVVHGFKVIVYPSPTFRTMSSCEAAG